jgi:hypothetical protein
LEQCAANTLGRCEVAAKLEVSKNINGPLMRRLPDVLDLVKKVRDPSGFVMKGARHKKSQGLLKSLLKSIFPQNGMFGSIFRLKYFRGSRRV